MYAHIMLIIFDITNIFTENTLLIYILASQKCKECLEKNLRKCDCLVLFQLVIVTFRGPRGMPARSIALWISIQGLKSAESRFNLILHVVLDISKDGFILKH